MSARPLPAPPPSADELRLPPLAELIAALAAPVLEQDAAAAGVPGAMRIADLVLDLPFELELGGDAPSHELGAAPPTQRTRTTFLPVLHRLRMRIASGDGGLDDQPLEA